MSGFQKPTGSILDYGSTRSLHDASGSYSAYGQSPYVTGSIVPSPMADQTSQISDCVPYIPSSQYGSSYEEAQSPLLSTRTRQLPEIVNYSPQRGSEGTRVVVQIQSPFDLHTSTYGALFVVFGSKKCECLPTFLGFQGSSFQYALAADAPDFILTGSPSFATPIQVVMEGQGDCPPTNLQVGVYTYEQVAQPTASTSSSSGDRKRKLSSYTDANVPTTNKRATGPVMPKVETQENYTFKDNRSASYSPYLQSLPAMAGFITPYNTGPSRNNSVQYSTISATSQPSMRAPSPMTPGWSPSYVAVPHDPRGLVGHGMPHQVASTVRASNPTLIRTSTLQHSNGMGQTQAFNPYAMYPTKAILKLSGNLDSMTENWTKEECVSQRRLVQFTRSQTGSTIHGEFKAVTPEERAPNSICISCIMWEGKDECFVTSVDTIYLLESLVAVRFTVEEKNRIRRNLEGFRPLTVSKAKADSEDFFKVIMGFPAPKPRNIEKDVKVFPWKILSLALKKIIGKYSASYSSTAGALPTPMTTYAPTGSDSGTEPHTVNSPQSVSDSGPNYATGMARSVYQQPNQTYIPMTTGPELHSVVPSNQSYSSVGAYSYPAVCHPQNTHSLVAPTPRTTWDMHGLGAPTSSAPVNTCYNYMDPVYPLHHTAQGP